MTVATKAVSHSYKPGAAMALEAIPFQFLDVSEFRAARIDAVTRVRTTLIAGQDFAVSGDGMAKAGRIRALTAWDDADDVLELRRVTPRIQKAIIKPHEPVPAVEVERQLDRQTFGIQEIGQELVDLEARALRVPVGETVPTLLSPKANPNRALATNAFGEFVYTELPDALHKPKRDDQLASIGQTVFTVPFEVDPEVLVVVVNGLIKPRSAYLVTVGSGTSTVTFLTPFAAAAAVSFHSFLSTGVDAGTLGFTFLHSYRYPGEATDDAALARALVDVRTPGNANYRKVIWPFPGKGAAAAIDATDAAALDPVTGDPVPPEFVAQVGDYLISTFNQNQVEGLAGNLCVSDVTIWDPTGLARFRRGDRTAPHILHACPVPTPETTAGGVDTQAYVYARNRLIGLTFVGENWRLGYREHFDDCHFNASDGWLVQGCRFFGSGSDGLHWGAGIVGGGVMNMLQRDCHEQELLFDGYNQNNRNAVSTIGGVNMTYSDQVIRNFTRPGNGNATPADPFDPLTGIGNPGSRDYEPNSGFTVDPQLRDCGGDRLRAYKCGGSAIAMLPGTANNIAHPITGFLFSNTTAEDVEKGLCQAYADDNAKRGLGVEFDGFAVTGGKRGFEVTRFKGVAFRRGLFRRQSHAAVAGYLNGWRAADFILDDVTFEETGTESGASLDLRGVNRSAWGKVTFRDYNGTAIVLRGGNVCEEFDMGDLVFERNAGADYVAVNSIIVVADDPNNADTFPVIDGATVTARSCRITGAIAAPTVPLIGMPIRIPPSPPAGCKLFYSKGAWVPASAALMERGGPSGWHTRARALGDPADFAPGVPFPGAWREATAVNTPTLSYSGGGYLIGNGRLHGAGAAGSGTARAWSALSVYDTSSSGAGIGVEVECPFSGEGGVFVGFTASGTPAATADRAAGIAFNGLIAQLQAFALGGPSGTAFSSFELRRKLRLTARDAGAGVIVKFWRQTALGGATFVQVGSSINIGTIATLALLVELSPWSELQILDAGTATAIQSGA